MVVSPSGGRNYTPIPSMPPSAIDNYIDVDTVLRQHEYGNFAQSARFADQLGRDDRIYGVHDTRLGGMTAASIAIKPATSKRKARKVAEILGGVDEVKGQWEEMFPASTIRQLLRWGQLIGIGVADIFWDSTETEWRPRLRIWHPQFVYWRMDTMSYWIVTAEGSVELPRVDENPRSDGLWVVWTPFGFREGWKQALIRPLASIAVSRGWVGRDWNRYNEAHGTPMRKAIVPDNASDEVKDDFHDRVANAGADTTITCPQEGGESGRKFDVGYVEAVGKTYETFKDRKGDLDVDVAIVILGQNLTTQVDGGSLAASKTHELIRGDKKAMDAQIMPCLRQQVLTGWAARNFTDPELAPVPEYLIGDSDDEATQATGYKALGDAIQSLDLAGVPVDVRTMADRAGIPMLSEEEQAAQDAEQAQQQQQVPAPGEPGSTSGNGGPAADGTDAAAARASAAPRLVAGRRKPSRYVTDLEAHARRQAATAFKPNLEIVKRAVESATDYPDLRRRLVIAFGQMDPAAMATVLRKAHVMAQLAGRGSALEDLT